MCGRYVLALSAADLIDGFSHLKLNPLAGLDALDLRPRYNIAPSTQVLVVRRRRADDAAQGGDTLVAETMRWGLVPGWLKDLGQAKGWSNARGETVATNGVFKNAFKRWRCIVPAQGFYEWQTLPAPAGRPASKPLKLPHYIHPTGEPFFGFAGLCERWVSADGEIVQSCCIITTEPNALMARIHDRMPVILDRADWADWLDPRQTDVAQLQRHIRPYPAERMAAHPVGTAVSVARNEGATLIVALTEAQYHALTHQGAASPPAPPPAAGRSAGFDF
jgi:putative SOS response-associated peptidase YedK